MEEMDLIEWVILLITAVLAIFGLFLTAAAGSVYALGLALFVAAVVFGFWFLKRHFDRRDAQRRR